MKFKIYFLKENERTIDYEEAIDFFLKEKYTSVSHTDDDEMVISLDDEQIKLHANFILSRGTVINDLYRLDPKYLDIKFRMETDLLMPLYKINKIIDLVKRFCVDFDVVIYNDIFENVTPFNDSLIIRAYEKLRELYISQNNIEYQSLHYVKEERLNNILKYLDENYELKKFYSDTDVLVPKLELYSEKISGKVNVLVDYELGFPSLFPNECDLVRIDRNKVVLYSDVLKYCEKYLDSVPGFIKGTKVTPVKNLKKIKKMISKIQNFVDLGNYLELEISDLIDK